MPKIGEQLERGAHLILEMEQAAQEQRYEIAELRRGYHEAAKCCKLSQAYRDEIRWMLDTRRVQGFARTEKWADCRLLEELLRIGEVPNSTEILACDVAEREVLDAPEAKRRIAFLERHRRFVLDQHEKVLKELKDIDRELLVLGVDPERGEACEG